MLGSAVKNHYPTNSCLTQVCSVHGLAVTTIEGLGSTKRKIHPVQERIAKTHGSLCGYCTPGMVMSMYALLKQNPKPKMEIVAESLVGNLCRCTGYRPIIEAFKTFTDENNAVVTSENQEKLFNPKEFTLYDPCQDPIFPPELKNSDKYDREFLKIAGPRTTWYRPITLDQLLTIKYKNPGGQIVAGNTVSVFECKFAKICKLMIYPKSVPEMTQICQTKDGVRIGATTTIKDLNKFLIKMENEHPEKKTRLFRAVTNIVRWMCSKQVKSIGTVGGNIVMGAPISDLAPILIAGRANLEIHHKKSGSRLIPLDTNFSLGRHKTLLKSGDVLLAIHLPFSNRNEYFQVIKQARRRDVDQSIVMLAVKVEFEDNTNIVSSIRFGIGGVAVKPIDAPKTQSKLKGLPWEETILKPAYTSLLEDVSLNFGAPGGMISYRLSLVLSLFLKAFLAIAKDLKCNLGNKIDAIIKPEELSGIGKFETKDYKSSQKFYVVPDTQPITDAVHRPLMHSSALKQATGEAVFVNDMPRYENELSLAYIFSSRAHANIVSIGANESLNIKGVHAFFSENDVSPEINRTRGYFNSDEQIFYSKKVTSSGQIIGAILANDQPTAQKAARLVKVQYEPLSPLIMTIDDAIEHNSFFHESKMELCHGKVEEILNCAPNVIKGSCRITNQKHFYFEVQSCLIVPQEDDAMEIYSSTQSPNDLASIAANLLGVHQNKVRVHVKRVGGAFGGKEWKSIVIARPAILAAKKFQRPIRCVLERNQDTLMSGGRIPYLFNYTVGFDEQGKILACDFDIYLNCGYSLEVNQIALARSLNNLDNAFKIPAIRARGQLCKTNIPTNDSMTGLGAPEVQFPTSCVIEEIAESLKKDPAEIAQINLYDKRDTSFYAQKMENITIKECWGECLENSKYREKRETMKKFNSENRYKKRGISIVPTKFGMLMADLPPQFLQATVLVNVYTDGSVLLAYGGVEMGQGLHTKIKQIATRILEIPMENIHIENTATNIVPNGAPTVAGIGLDLYEPAVIDACKKIKDRLRPYKRENPSGTWKEVVSMAYSTKTCLTATGFIKHKAEELKSEIGNGNLFSYFVCGAACSEVEVDVLTGDHQVLRTDIVLDIGKSLNPAIDIGQIEGAFIKGYGLFMLEETLYSPYGYLVSAGLAMYKLPGIRNIPIEFNISLLKGCSDAKTTCSSKVCVEPALFLASSIYFAIKDAIKAARKENGVSTVFHLESPASVEKIRMACEDEITKMVPQNKKQLKPWTVTV